MSLPKVYLGVSLESMDKEELFHALIHLWNQKERIEYKLRKLEQEL